MKTFYLFSGLGLACLFTSVAAEAQSVSIHNITVRRHSTVTLSNATADANFQTATNRMTNDNDGAGSADVACTLGWTRNGNVTSFTNTDGDISTDAEVNTMLGSVNGYTKVVDTITRCGTTGSYRGCGGVGSRNGYIVTDEAPDDSWAHEFGHNVGLGHVTTDSQRIMASGTSNRQRVTSSECTSYQSLVDVDGPGGGTVQGDGVAADELVLPAQASQSFAGIPIEQVARLGFDDSVPVEVSQFYGQKDVAVLKALLADPAEIKNHGNILSLIGLISAGANEDVNAITTYLDKGGPDHAMAAGAIALGYLSQRTNNGRAFAYLVRKAKDSSTRDAEWATLGLGLSGKGEAIAELRGLKAEKAPADARAVRFGRDLERLDQSLADAEQILQKGLAGYYGR